MTIQIGKAQKYVPKTTSIKVSVENTRKKRCQRICVSVSRKKERAVCYDKRNGMISHPK